MGPPQCGAAQGLPAPPLRAFQLRTPESSPRHAEAAPPRVPGCGRWEPGSAPHAGPRRRGAESRVRAGSLGPSVGAGGFLATPRVQAGLLTEPGPRPPRRVQPPTSDVPLASPGGSWASSHLPGRWWAEVRGHCYPGGLLVLPATPPPGAWHSPEPRSSAESCRLPSDQGADSQGPVTR